MSSTYLSFDRAVEPRVDTVTLEQRSVWILLVKRLDQWRNEFPKIVRGLWSVTAPFRRQLAIIAGFNFAIVVWETAQPFILTWGVNSFEAHVPYLEIVAIIVGPVLGLAVPHGIVIPLLRELYINWNFKPPLDQHLTLLTMQCTYQHGPPTDPKIERQGGPVAQEGRDVVHALIDSLLRDPFFALRGLGVLLFIAIFKSAILGALLVGGMMVDLCITLLMEVKLDPLFKAQQEMRFKLKGIENEFMNGEINGEEALRTFKSKLSAYTETNQRVGVLQLLFTLLLREGFSLAVRLGSMLLVAWWVHTGDISIGAYLLFTSLAGRANDPLFVFYGWQGQMMAKRESIDRWALAADRDFGYKKAV
jgi:ABC-type multidrug transport system fused ATPase/permease subunit